MASIPFSNTTTKGGIIQLCEFNCGLGDAGISGNSTRLKQFTALANIAMSEIWHLIFSCSSGWIYDDSNQTDLPQATQNLSAGTAKYALPSGALVIDRIEVMDSSGNYRKLKAIDAREIDIAIDELRDTDGLPQYYRLIGQTIELFPAPAAASVTTTAGLKVYFERGGVSFDSTDTSDIPGFASEYHDLVPIKTSIKWLQVNKPDSNTLISLKTDEIKRETQFVEYQNLKFKDKKPLIVTARQRKSR
jgi:hypothetical protein